MKTKVLIGEDNLVTQQVLKAMLESKHCEVTTASTHEDLITHLENGTFNFLLLDYHLDQDADFILKKVRNLTNDSRTTPVYVMSAGKEEEVRKKLNDFTIEDFLKKPIENDTVDTLLSRYHVSNPTNNDRLKSIIGDNQQRITAINDFFLAEVPPALTAIAEGLKKNDYISVKKLVHRIRPAYTYLNRDDIQIKMGEWENDLIEGRNKEQYDEILKDINQQTKQLLSTFSQNPSSKPEATPHLQPIAYPQLEGVSILLVDDNQVIISVFTSLFQSHKMIVHAAKNGSEGLSEAINKQPDLVLMDLHMPGTDGVTAIAEIRKKGITTPIIAISNATHRKDEALAAGANNFLLKPVNASDLLDTIAAELNL